MDSQSPQPRAGQRAQKEPQHPTLASCGHQAGSGQYSPRSQAVPGQQTLSSRAGSPQGMSPSRQELFSLGFVVQSTSNNDRALPAQRLLRLTPRACNSKTGPVTRLWEWAWLPRDSLALLGTWSQEAPLVREGGGQRAAESLRSHHTGVKVPLPGNVAAPGLCYESRPHRDPCPGLGNP